MENLFSISRTGFLRWPVIFLVTQPTVSALKMSLVMVALWNRADHYIFALWFLLSTFFFSLA